MTVTVKLNGIPFVWVVEDGFTWKCVTAAGCTRVGVPVSSPMGPVQSPPDVVVQSLAVTVWFAAVTRVTERSFVPLLRAVSAGSETPAPTSVEERRTIGLEVETAFQY